MRIAAFNVCGIRASQNKGLKAYVAAENADILCLTETKIDADPNFDFLDIYPFRFFGADPKKGNAGIAIVSKIEPISGSFYSSADWTRLILSRSGVWNPFV